MALQRTVASPKHSNPQFPEHNLHHKPTPQSSAHGAPAKHHSHAEAVKGAGHEHLNSFHLSPQIWCPRACAEHPRVKAKRRPGRLCLQGRLQIRTWQLQSPGSSSSRHCRPVQSSTYRGENNGLEAARPEGTKERLQNSPGVWSQHLAASCLTCMGAPRSLLTGTWIRVWGKFPALPWADRIPGAAPPSPPRKEWEKPKTRAGIASASPIH